MVQRGYVSKRAVGESAITHPGSIQPYSISGESASASIRISELIAAPLALRRECNHKTTSTE